MKLRLQKCIDLQRLIIERAAKIDGISNAQKTADLLALALEANAEDIVACEAMVRQHKRAYRPDAPGRDKYRKSADPGADAVEAISGDRARKGSGKR